MTVDVVYEGLTIATAAPARAEGDALFIELESPMPIGTALVIRSDEGARAARVERVREGQGGAGVIVRFGAKAAEKKPESKQPDAKPIEAKQAEADDDEADEKSQPQEHEPKGRKRKNTRKTVLGH